MQIVNKNKIETAQENHFKDVLKLHDFLSPTEPLDEANLKKLIADGHVWIAWNGSEAVGYCIAELFDEIHPQLPNSIFLSELYVLESFRGQGIGKKLVQTFLKSKYPKKFFYFSLTHNPKEFYLTEFYKLFGFEVVGKTQAGNVKMIKKI